MEEDALTQRLDDAMDRVVRELAKSADEVGRFGVGAGSKLTDGETTYHLSGLSRSEEGLTVEATMDGYPIRYLWSDFCSRLHQLVPAGFTGHRESLPEHAHDWRVLPADVQQRYIELAGHLRQAITGSPDGNTARAARLDRLDPRFDPTLVPNLIDRLRAKSIELKAMGHRGVSLSSLQRKAALFEKHGILGLVDRRHGRRADPLDGIDEACLEVISQTVNRNLAQAKLTNHKLNSLARAALLRAGLEDKIPKRKVQQAVGELTRGRAFHRTARSRGTNSNRPQRAHRRMPVTRPGEIVQIDATPSDAHVWFPDVGFHKAVILTAIDAYSKQILALRVVPHAITTRDTSLLLWDITRSEVRSGGWPRQLERHHGMPRLVVINEDDTRLRNERKESSASSVLGHKNALHPSTVVIDHGREFDSAHFLDACARNGITVLFARPHTATDKGIVESWHATLDIALSTIPGYKGPNPLDHPADAEAQAMLTCADLQDALWTWILTIYHERRHSGLRHPTNPAITMTPNMAFDYFMEVGGHIEVDPDPFAPLLFLSCETRNINDGGIKLHNRTFSSEALFQLRRRTQRGRGAAAIQVPVYYDRWDMTRVFLRDPNSNEWICVPSTSHGAAFVPPFSEALSRYAIEKASRGDGPPSDADIARKEIELLAAFANGDLLDRRERRLHCIEETRATIHALDIEGWHQDLRDLAFPPSPAYEPSRHLDDLTEWTDLVAVDEPGFDPPTDEHLGVADDFDGLAV